MACDALQDFERKVRNAKRGPDQAEKSSLMKSQWMSRRQCQALSVPADFHPGLRDLLRADQALKQDKRAQKRAQKRARTAG